MVVMSIKISDGSVPKSRNENGNCSTNGPSARPVKWKRRSVSAVRDFPPRCGPAARRINVVPYDAEPVSSPVGDNRVADDVPVDAVPCEAEPVASPVGDNRVASDAPVDVVPREAEPVASPVGDSVAGDVPVDVVPHEAEQVASPVVNNHVASDVSADVFSREVEPVLSPFGYTRVVSGAGADEPAGSVVGNVVNHVVQNGDVQVGNGGGVIKEVKRRMKYTPRKVSAVRDFPPYCGWNAEEPTEEERIRINGIKSFGTEANGSVKGGLVQKTQLDETNEASVANQEIIVESKTDVEDWKTMKVESSKKVQNIGQACQELVVYTRDKDMMITSPVDDAHGVDSEEDVRDNTPLSLLHKDVNIKNREVGSKKHVKKRPGDDTKDSTVMEGKIMVVLGLKAPSLCALGIQQKDLTNKAKGNASITPKNSVKKDQKIFGGESSATGKVAYTGTLEMVEKDSTKGNEDASMTPKRSTKKKQKKDTVAGTLAMVVRNEDDFVVGIENKDLIKGKGDASVTPKRSVKKKQKKVTPDSKLAMIVRNEEDSVTSIEEKEEGSSNLQGTHDVDVSLPPFGPKSSNDARNKVRETLRYFQALCRKLLQGEEAKTTDVKLTKRRVDLNAKLIMDNTGRTPTLGEKTYGPVPGVEVGDEFQYRVELALVGIHRPFQGGIDYVKKGNEFFAVSVVASGGYKNEVDKPDCMIYSGAGGVGKDKSFENQKLERGNLALKNNMDLRYPVRVVRGFLVKPAESSDSKSKALKTYIYDGLYTVESCHQETGRHGNMEFRFELKRVPGQPQLAKREMMSKKFKIREGVCVKDISNGKEVFPICAINTIDDQKPPEFTYITKIMYPDWYKPIHPEGCDCVGRCSEKKCPCAFKNGGEIPYNRNGAIVEAKPLVYECGPSCRCPPSCYNRVTQHGMKIHLEIFKTESRGWGVRSLSSISSGSFICEYVGELLEESEAEERKSNDEYLFDIGQNYNDCSLNPDTKPGEPVNTDSGFTIDAAYYGNVGRFINHSCSPNLYAQNVLYDEDDKRMPHIMLFAAENIPPLTELTYHYNYAVDEVCDADGNIKVKHCYCGSSECTGRMY